MNIVWCVLLLLLGVADATAYDGNQTLSFPKFKRENFMDITAYQFRKQQDDEWQASDNGFRAAGGSMGPDFLYSTLAFKYRTNINPYTELRISSRQEDFYTTTPIHYRLEIGGRPLNWLYLSLSGMPAYDKRNSDMGWAIELGSRPASYIRYAYTRHDLFFNEKNTQDDAHYTQEPTERNLEAALLLDHRFQFRFNLIQDEHFNKVLATDLLGNRGEFSYKGDSGEVVFDYLPGANRALGITARGFSSKKSLKRTGENRVQRFEYLSVQSYYIFPVLNGSEITLAMRHDRLDYNTRDNLNPGASLQRYFDTSQVYGVFLQSFRPWINFEYALHLGEATMKDKGDRLVNGESTNSGRESKFRIGFELLSTDKNNRLMFNTNWNLDHLAGQYWDGGHVSFQGVF